MSATLIRIFAQQQDATDWATQLHGNGYSVAISDASDSVTIAYSQNGGPKQLNLPGTAFVVMGFNKPA